MEVAVTTRIFVITYRIGAACPIYHNASLSQLIPSYLLLLLVPSKYTQGARSRTRPSGVLSWALSLTAFGEACACLGGDTEQQKTPCEA
jgi:hypothetical protein